MTKHKLQKRGFQNPTWPIPSFYMQKKPFQMFQLKAKLAKENQLHDAQKIMLYAGAVAQGRTVCVMDRRDFQGPLAGNPSGAESHIGTTDHVRKTSRKNQSQGDHPGSIL